MKRALLVLGLLLPGVALAEDDGGLHLSVRSLTQLTRELQAGNLGKTEPQVPTYQFLTLSGKNLGGTGAFAELSGWAAQQLATGSLAPPRPADLSFGYVGWQGAAGKVQVGRQLVMAGAPRYVFLDGVSGQVQLPATLQASAYGGTAAMGGWDNAFQAPVVGGRLAWSPSLRGHIGLAYQEMPGQWARRSIGTDFSTRAVGPVTWTGAVAYDLLGKSLQEARLDGQWRPYPWMGVFARGEVRDPLAYLPRDSIFLAFAQRIDGLVGGGVDVTTPGALLASASYDRFVVADGGRDGYRGNVDLKLRVNAAGTSRAGMTYGRMVNGANGYTQARAWWRGVLPGQLALAVDVDQYWFFAPVRGATDTLMPTVSTRWRGLRGVAVGVDGQLWSGPYFTRQGLVMVTVQVGDGR